jgi:hypothetical protein
VRRDELLITSAVCPPSAQTSAHRRSRIPSLPPPPLPSTRRPLGLDLHVASMSRETASSRSGQGGWTNNSILARRLASSGSIWGLSHASISSGDRFRRTPEGARAANTLVITNSSNSLSGNSSLALRATLGKLWISQIRQKWTLVFSGLLLSVQRLLVFFICIRN